MGVGTAAASIVPDAEKVDDEVDGELHAENLRDHVEVGEGGALQDSRVVADVLAAVAGRLDRQVDAEALEVDDDAEDEERGAEVHQVGQVLAVLAMTVP